LSYPRSQGTALARATNETGVGKNGETGADFRSTNRYISETIEDMHTVTMEDK